MKKFIRFDIFLIWLFTVVVAGATTELGTISLILGKTHIQKQLDKDWKKAQLKSIVFEHDKLKTQKKSRCEVKLTNRNIFRIGENTTVELIRNDDRNVKANISIGTAWINMFPSNSGGKFSSSYSYLCLCYPRNSFIEYQVIPIIHHIKYMMEVFSVSPLDENGNVLPDTTFIVDAGNELIIAKKFLKNTNVNSNKHFKSS